MQRKQATSDNGWPIHESAAISMTTTSTGDKLGVRWSVGELGSREACEGHGRWTRRDQGVGAGLEDHLVECP